MRFKCQPSDAVIESRRAGRLIALLLTFATLGSVSAARTGYAADTTSSASPATTTLRMRGTISTYDTANRMLSLMTADGTLRIQLARDVRIRRGWGEIDADALAKLAGYRAAVRYSESGGIKTAESIHVFSRNERGER